MRVLVQSKYGPPKDLQIQRQDIPEIGEDEVLIKVKASSINRTDCAILSAKPLIMRLVYGLFKPRTKVSGTDYAGEVLSCGTKVTGIQRGDRVFGFSDMGLSSHASHLIIPKEQTIVAIPENTSFKEAVAIAEGFHYAYNTINKVPLDSNHKVLINGATGAIGIACLQLAKDLGAEITAVCNTKNIDLIRSLGANTIIDYEQEDFTQRIDQFDYIFDAVGKSSFFACKHLLKPNGVYISSELGPMLQHVWMSLLFPVTRLFRLWRRKGVKFPIPSKPKVSLLMASQMLEEGRLKGIYEREYPLEEYERAFNYVASGQKTGAVLFSFD